ncbi:MAG: helix-turn-helix domain-containing protein [Gemmatimonadaceae bacterium]|jgi:AraC-like DNA-binding protein|nr:helix-turn-helix domain-containing protein [Gemmatimonadaceae bacterium]
MIAFGPLSSALSLGALNGAAIAVLLLRTRGNREANRILAALLGIVVLRLVPYIIGYAGFYDAYPWLSFAPFDLPLAIGPLLWLYVVRLTGDAMPARWWLHLVPAALHFTIYFALFAFVPLETRHALVRAWIDPLVAPVITFASLLGLAAYGWRALQVRQRYQQWLDDHLSNRVEYSLTWLGWLLRIMAAVGVLWFAVAITDQFVRPLSYFDEFPFYLVQALAVWCLGLMAYREADRRYPTPGTEARDELAGAVLPTPREAAAATATRDVTDRDDSAPDDVAAGPDWAALGSTYLTAMRREEWWRDPQLTLSRLARHLATNTSYLSKALNRGVGQNFNECINRMRVDGVKHALDAGSTLDLVQIGFDCGFNSKASFQRAFVLYAGQTPSAYRDAIKREPPRRPDRPGAADVSTSGVAPASTRP